MNGKHRITLRFVVICALIPVAAFVLADYESGWFSVDAGGNTTYSSGGDFELALSIGQPDANPVVLTGGDFELVGGFWAPRARLIGDLNCDGAINALDIDPFALTINDPDEYRNQYPDCDIWQADINGDGSIDTLDVDDFVDLLASA